MDRIASRRPLHSEYSSDDHGQLIEQVAGDCVLAVLDSQRFWLHELTGFLSTEQIDKIHPPYGWTLRQVFEHCANAERVFGYRALRFAAGDAAELPGWDENRYADCRFGLGNFGQIVSEIDALRRSNLILLRRIIPEAWDRSGAADGQTVSVRALAWIMAGHLQHHLEIVEKRCGVSVRRSPG